MLGSKKRQNELSWEAVCSKLLIRGPATFGNKILVFTGLQGITIQECTARSEMEAYISLTRPVCVVNIEII